VGASTTSVGAHSPSAVVAVGCPVSRSNLLGRLPPGPGRQERDRLRRRPLERVLEALRRALT